MLLGKCPRGPVRRTTSMTGISVNLSETFDHDQINDNNNNETNQQENYSNNNEMSSFYQYDPRFLAALSPRNVPTRRNSADFLETSHFLRTCGFCQRRLAPGKDIYMYRGDTAFCSLECREKQMKHDERKEKTNNIIGRSKKEDHFHASSSTNNSSPTKSSSSGKNESLVAA